MNFGTVELEDGHWAIRTEPHVRARFKRVFARSLQWATDVLHLSDTPENARELIWFLQRYPMEMNKSARRRMQKQAASHRDTEAKLSELLGKCIPPRDIVLAEPARDYQKIAAHAAMLRGGLLLADDVGLGKSVSAICPMAEPENLPAVVVCPAHMPGQWAEFLQRFVPGLRVHVLRKSTPYPLIRSSARQQDLYPDRMPDVIVTSYHKLRGWSETLAQFVRYAAFDECQQLRNPDSDIYRACKHLSNSVRLRMGLSATPIYNYGSEFFHVIDALSPGALGEYQEFVREWCTADPGNKARIRDTEAFEAYLRREGIMLRRTRREVGRELPALTKIVHNIDSDVSVLNELTGTAIELAKTIVARNERFRGEKMQAAGQFDMLMRQATGIAKAPYVAEFVRLLVENGERVVLFGWHRAVIEIWRERLADLNPVLYSGSEDPKQKAASIEAFTSGTSKVLIMSLRSGAGVDGLQHVCRTVVFGELDWSPGVHVQCTGRVDRDGQTDPVMAYFLVSNSGSDPVVSEVCGIKREQIEGVLNPGVGLTERVDTGEAHIRQLAQAFLMANGIRFEDLAKKPTEPA